MAKQHLDPNNVALGILNPLTSGQGAQNPELSAAITHATNEWQVAEWTSRDARLRASVVVPYEDPPAAVKEMELRAGDPNFAQVLLLTRTAEPLGQRRYWPIYEAAAAAGLPVGIHAFGYGGWPISPGGWGPYYIEEMVGHAQAQQSLLISMIFEGVFERFPTLKVVLIEGGLAWAPALAWRMDRQWAKLRKEVPHLKRPPSEYMRTNVWFTTQPIEEPEPRSQLLRRDRLDRLGPRAVRHRLSALGLRRSGARAAGADERQAAPAGVPGECENGVRGGVTCGRTGPRLHNRTGLALAVPTPSWRAKGAVIQSPRSSWPALCRPSVPPTVWHSWPAQGRPGRHGGIGLQPRRPAIHACLRPGQQRRGCRRRGVGGMAAAQLTRPAACPHLA